MRLDRRRWKAHSPNVHIPRSVLPDLCAWLFFDVPCVIRRSAQTQPLLILLEVDASGGGLLSCPLADPGLGALMQPYHSYAAVNEDES